MISPPAVDGRRVESFFQELRRFAPHYTPDLNMTDEQSAGVALMRIFAQLAEIVAVRLDQAPQKHFVAFLDKLGITLLPARPARAAVTFRLASGLETEVSVPAGTRVTAPGIDDEIPFETTDELVAIPGVLQAMYGVDPLADKIFSPPPGFLKQESRKFSELSYEIQSFVARGANRFQLNHTTELEPGSFLRIGCKQKTVVETVEEGNFVTLYKPLGDDFPEGTIVVPIRNFEVFNGIDQQEHILYIAHDDLFTIKEEVEISLQIDLKDTGATLEPLDLEWQFWTEDKTVTPPEHWRKLDVKSDGTLALSSSGRIVLVKPADFEIKTRKVNGRESRWIRAELQQKLPVGSRELPEIETISVSVNTRVDENGDPIGIVADQGFYNATPLDLKVDPGVGFFPFGTEPRQFDQFYIASAEAFSKKEATVVLDFSLDLQTLAGPSVVKSNAGLRAYSVGLRHKLYELDVDGGRWNDLNSPFDLRSDERPQGSRYFAVEDSVPAAITNSARNTIFVFVKTEDALDNEINNRANKIWGHSHKSTGADTNPIWFDLDAPTGAGKKLIRFNPDAVTPSGWLAPNFAIVFAVDGDKRLNFITITEDRKPVTGWTRQSTGEPTCGSSPFAVKAGSNVLVFITSEDGVVYRLQVTNPTTATWVALTPTSSDFKAKSRPFAQPIGGGPDAKVFVVGTDGGNELTLFECDTRPTAQVGGKFVWNDLGHPPDVTIAEDDPAPDGYVEDVANTVTLEGKHIFVRGTDNQLWERLDHLRWEFRRRPTDPKLRAAPAVNVDDSATPILLDVFSASNQNSVVTWQFEIYRSNSTTDVLALLLGDAASSTDGEYDGDNLEIRDTTDTLVGDSTVRRYDGSQKLARIHPPLSDFPLPTDKCVIAGEDLGAVRPETSTLLALHPHKPDPDTIKAQGIAVRINDVFRLFNSYSRMTGVVSLAGLRPDTSPFRYSLYALIAAATTEYISVEDLGTVPQLSWEYFNGRGWLSLTVTDATRNLLSSGTVTIDHLPPDIESTEVAGQENFWIRARLVGGDYGRETFKLEGTAPNQTIVSLKSSLRPPKVENLRISYKAEPLSPEICLTFNNLNYLDQTAAAEAKDSHFPPFETLEEQSFTIFFGFDKTFKTGPVRMLLDAAERNFDESKPPEFEWSFRKDRKWKKLDVEDGSVALTRQGILTVSASDELTRETRFGEPLFWIKGSLRVDRALAEADIEPEEIEPTCEETGSVDNRATAATVIAAASADYPLPLLLGAFLNTVWTIQGETITEEIVGSGDGEQNQSHAMQHGDVLDGEDIRIQEALSAEERERIERELGKNSVTDREDLGGTWVRWKSVKALFDCGPQDRCYEIDRAAGLLRFGDGVHGSIAPAGVDNIRAFSYRRGGGAAGNVNTNEIQSLATSVAGIESVFNPAPAGGGSDKAETTEMLTIGPRRLSHRDRAVSAEDFEELAYEASRQVAKARCLRTTNLIRAGVGLPDPCDARQFHQPIEERGFVSLIIVPRSTDPRPCPSLQLRRVVKEYLRDRAPIVVAAGERIVVRPPDYVTVSVQAKIFVTTLDKAASVEKDARTGLEKFLHPVSGGPEGAGWEFGRPVTRSDIFAVLERIADVDRVEDLIFVFRDKKDPDRVTIGPNEILASGEHRLAIKKA